MKRRSASPAIDFKTINKRQRLDTLFADSLTKQPPYWPVSEEESTEAEVEETKILLEVFKDVLEEDPAIAGVRDRALEELDDIAFNWIEKVLGENVNNLAKSKHSIKKEYKVVAYGSTELKAWLPDSDIDVILITSPIMSRKRWIEEFPGLLGQNKNVTNIICLENAFVPIIQFSIFGVQVDLGYACLTGIHHGMKGVRVNGKVDLKSALSLNGIRTSKQLLCLIGDQSTFSQLLRIVKHWAKRRKIYSNQMGYLGGVTCAVLAAKVYQMFPKLSLAGLVRRFFTMWSVWEFDNVVALCKMPSYSAYTRSNLFALYSLQFNPRKSRPAMAIVTPSYPCSNASRNATKITKNTIQKEFNRALELITGMRVCTDPKVSWSVFRKDVLCFKTGFPKHVVIKIHSTKDLYIWKTSVFHKVRGFFLRLQDNEDLLPRVYPGVVGSHARPNTRAYLVFGFTYAERSSTGNRSSDIGPTVNHFINGLKDLKETPPDATVSCNVYQRDQMTTEEIRRAFADLNFGDDD